MRKAKVIKKGGKSMKRILVLFVLLGIITALSPAANAAVLWVVPENYDSYDDLTETVIDNADMGTSFSGNVQVLNQASPQDADAMSVSLKFFVNDASNIVNIRIGTAKRIESGIVIDPNHGPSGAVVLEFAGVSSDPPVPAGYGVSYLIDDIPFSGGPSQTGNPDDGNFNPDATDVIYVRVPFTINFDEPPVVGFTLYLYADNDAENELTGQERVNTAYSHDGGYTHVPEFSTIAIPVATILGLLFFFNHRKRKKS